MSWCKLQMEEAAQSKGGRPVRRGVTRALNCNLYGDGTRPVCVTRGSITNALEFPGDKAKLIVGQP
jgi:hypothetical protein